MIFTGDIAAKIRTRCFRQTQLTIFNLIVVCIVLMFIFGPLGVAQATPANTKWCTGNPTPCANHAGVAPAAFPFIRDSESAIFNEMQRYCNYSNSFGSQAISMGKSTSYPPERDEIVVGGATYIREITRSGFDTNLVTVTCKHSYVDNGVAYCSAFDAPLTSIVERAGECTNISFSLKNKSQELILTALPNEKLPRPGGAEGNGKSTYDMIAKLTEGGSPKSGKTITFKVDVNDGSGGHDHHNANRPKGALSTIYGTTDSNGEVKLTFTAPVIAGTHTVTATCTNCNPSAISKDHTFDVKVPGLTQFSAGSDYALTSVDAIHSGRYYLTTAAQANLRTLIKEFKNSGWGTVALNDASLMWGGLYDINGNWMPSHKGHRTGEEIDISFKRANNPIDQNKRQRTYDALCTGGKSNIPFSILHHIGGKVPHYHVYLTGRKQGCFTLPT